MGRILCFLFSMLAGTAAALPPPGEGSGAEKFRQLDEMLPAPNAYRTASGAPGHGYWQQRADYVIDIILDDENQRIVGSELITYRNNSPDELRYLWLQVDSNVTSADAMGALAEPAPGFEELPYDTLRTLLTRAERSGGMEIRSVRDGRGGPLAHARVGTMLRIDLPQPLEPGERTSFSVDWIFDIPDAKALDERSGYEHFEDNDNYLYEIAQFYPRMAAYTDYAGWRHTQFLGQGEFTLELGDFSVRITVPADHVVAASGRLTNPREVLTARQRDRLAQARDADAPVFIVTPREASQSAGARTTDTSTWVFEANDVRDFAFASSRMFIWDAWGYHQGDDVVMAMSFYPQQAEPLWSRYATHAIVHTLEVYSRHTFDYPYPVAIAVNGPVGGMEYPMISFNAPRPFEDRTYWDVKPPEDDSIEWEHTKYGLISVIIHETGHNYFPMIVNSDERQWTWMDEGLNTFLQFLAEQQWEDDYPSRRGEPKDLVPMIQGETPRVPVMTGADSVLPPHGTNAYATPATALNILRETVLGAEAFDFAFREYARRWRFRRPTPADFFRTMEDASGQDLDWFWRGWFYSTDVVDIGIESVTRYELDTRDPEIERRRSRAAEAEAPATRSQQRFDEAEKRVDRYPELKDFYNRFDRHQLLPSDRQAYRELLDTLDENEIELLTTDRQFHVVELKNEGGLVMPVILQIEYEDGETEELRLPAQIWRYNAEQVSKLLLTDREIVAIHLDPYLETADVDTSDNHWPRRPIEERFQLFKPELKERNPMQELGETGEADDG